MKFSEKWPKHTNLMEKMHPRFSELQVYWRAISRGAMIKMHHGKPVQYQTAPDQLITLEGSSKTQAVNFSSEIREAEDSRKTYPKSLRRNYKLKSPYPAKNTSQSWSNLNISRYI